MNFRVNRVFKSGPNCGTSQFVQTEVCFVLTGNLWGSRSAQVRTVMLTGWPHSSNCAERMTSFIKLSTQRQENISWRNRTRPEPDPCHFCSVRKMQQHVWIFIYGPQDILFGDPDLFEGLFQRRHFNIEFKIFTLMAKFTGLCNKVATECITSIDCKVCVCVCVRWQAEEKLKA